MQVIRILFGILAVIFLMGPLFVILPLAFTQSGALIYPIEGWSMRWMYNLFNDPAWTRAIKNSLIIGLSSALLATVLGTLAALGLRGRFNATATAARTIFLLPVAIPTVVLGVGMQLVFSKLGLSSTFSGVIISHTVISIPFVLLTVSGALSGIDHSVERAAASLGASNFKIFGLITLPMALPGVVTGAVFAFANSLDEVVLVLFLGGPSQRTISREMFMQMRDSLTPVIAAAAFSLIVATFCIGALALWLRHRRNKLNATV